VVGRTKTEIIENKTQGKIFRVQCTNCNKKTRHMVVQSHDTYGHEIMDEIMEISWADNYQIIQCQGCEDVSFRHQSFFSEDQYDHGDDFSDGTIELLYPHRTELHHKMKALYNAPPHLRRIYRETIDSYNSESYTLAAAGLRTLIEGVCATQGVAKGPVKVHRKDGSTVVQNKKNIEGKINGLVEKRIINEKSATALHEHRFLGNEALHELVIPSGTDLVLAIEIMENLLETLFEVPEKANMLKYSRAVRKMNKGA